MKNTKNLTFGFVPIPVVLGVFVVSAAVIAGFILNNPFTSDAQGSNDFILPPAVMNRDIQAIVSDPTASSRWSGGIIRGEICFDVNPPTVGAKYRVALEMPLKDSPTSTTVTNKIIGASVMRSITNPSTIRCNSRNRRDDVFNAAFNIPDKDLWTEACPQIRVLVETQGNWKPIPQEEIARLSKEFLCPNGIPTSTPAPTTPPAATATVAPTRGVTPPFGQVTPQASQPTNPNKATGTISVFSCRQPQNVSLKVCDSSNGCSDSVASGSQTLALKDQESAHGIWLDRNQGNDRTYVYKYSVTQNSTGEQLTAGADVAFGNATAAISTIQSTDRNFSSSESTYNSLKVPASHDVTIDAQYLTCGCPFHARAYIKDVDTNEILQVTNPQIGTSNDMLVAKFGDTVFQTFNNGVIDVRADFFDFSSRFKTNPTFPFSEHGIDGLASVRLYAPGFDVVKHECQSNGGTDGCPGPGRNYSKETTSRDIDKLHIACGVDISYGWVVKKRPGTNLQALTGESLFTIDQADIDKNGIVNIIDLTTCVDEIGTEDGVCDLDGNGLTNTLDIVGVINFIGESTE